MLVKARGSAAGLIRAASASLTSHAVHHKVHWVVSEDLVKVGLSVVDDLIRPQALCNTTLSCSLDHPGKSAGSPDQRVQPGVKGWPPRHIAVQHASAASGPLEWV